MKLKDNKGLTGVDVAVSIVILLIFVSFITSLFYNLSNTSKRIEKKATATNLAIEVIEAMKATEFTTLAGYTADQKEMTADDITNLTGKVLTIPNGYTVKISIKNPNDDDNMGQVIKIITSEISYTENKKVETVKIETLVKNI